MMRGAAAKPPLVVCAMRLLLLPFALAAIVAMAAAVVPPPDAHDTVVAVVLFNRHFVVGASSLRSGLFRSTDGGVHWEHLGWENIRAFGVAVRDERMLLAAGNGVLRSTDGGAHWRIMTDWRAAEVLRVADDPRDPRRCYATSAHGFLRSSDDGATWDTTNAGLRSTFASSLLVYGDTILIGSEEGLYCSIDHGSRWSPVGDAWLRGTGILSIARTTDGTLFVGTEDRGIWHSTDNGASWTRASNGLSLNPWYCIAVDPAHAATLFAAGYQSGVWKSIDGGGMWLRAGDTLTGRSFHGLAVSPRDPSTIYVGEYNGGMWKSTNAGATWHFIGLDGSQVWEVVAR